LRTGGEVLGEPRLADARLADDQHEPTFPGARASERLVELRTLALTPDEGQRPRCRAGDLWRHGRLSTATGGAGANRGNRGGAAPASRRHGPVDRVDL